ncbi:ABC transporter ATP-binding protein [Paratractidigestivibacter sp.]|uniref:ABC transporter ATP-binding protein n=1 Tax=Paratractidigestivibacter sp. TaxID=2847316 RepID=UPI002ABE9A5B|nr:ABC transporter ATP-binding protein [Paratractidigestivibacter sp.]
MFRLRRYLRGHYAECVLAPSFKGLEAILQLLVPIIMSEVIDVGIANKDTAYILLHAGSLVLLAFFCYGISITAQYFSSKLAAQFGTALRDDLFRHVMTLSREDIDRLGRSSLVTRITNDAQQTQDGLNLFFRLILRAPFIIVGSIVAAFIVDGWEGAVLLASVTVAVAIILCFMRITTKRYRKTQKALDEVQLKCSENLEGARVLRAFCQEDAEKAAFGAAAHEVRDLQLSAGNLSSVVNPLTYCAANIGLVALLWVGGLQVNVGNLTQGQVVALVSYVSQTLVELLKLTMLITTLAKAQACASRINEVFDVNPTQVDGKKLADAGAGGAAIAFDDVSFAYPDAGGESLTHVSFSLPSGATLGVIGGTGSGKSTLAALAMRFYDATAGRVLVGGTDVRDLTQQSLRQEVGLVEQGPRLFSGTIASNLRWGGTDADDEALMAAVACAQAADVVESKGGLNGEVEQFGRNFSGGQRQRLAIARTLARRPRVLILDDASSALDFATDAKLRRAIKREYADAAVILISQRVAAVRGSDQILVLDGGRVAGLGTHEELLATCEVYREICDSQLSSEEVNR